MLNEDHPVDEEDFFFHKKNYFFLTKLISKKANLSQDAMELDFLNFLQFMFSFCKECVQHFPNYSHISYETVFMAGQDIVMRNGKACKEMPQLCCNNRKSQVGIA